MCLKALQPASMTHQSISSNRNKITKMLTKMKKVATSNRCIQQEYDRDEQEVTRGKNLHFEMNSQNVSAQQRPKKTQNVKINLNPLSTDKLCNHKLYFRNSLKLRVCILVHTQRCKCVLGVFIAYIYQI